jgi:hypothetical protein
VRPGKMSFSGARSSQEPQITRGLKGCARLLNRSLKEGSSWSKSVTVASGSPHRAGSRGCIRRINKGLSSNAA